MSKEMAWNYICPVHFLNQGRARFASGFIYILTSTKLQRIRFKYTIITSVSFVLNPWIYLVSQANEQVVP